MTTQAQTYPFQAETKQLLDIVIHSLYSHKEIFLRELVSNASDALDRVRLEALTTPEILDADEPLEIRLGTDPSARTLTIEDNGIGMSRDEVVAHIGTIAKSGTRELVDRLRAGGTGESLASLIGQFGVGFYSAFMVANRVVLVTRRAGEEKAVHWESTGDGTFELDEASRFSRGTTITLHLKPVDRDNGLDDFADVKVLESLVKRYSDFVAYPIRAKTPRVEPELDSSGSPVPGKYRTVVEERTLNSMRPIWTRPANEVREEEFAEFYKHVAHDWTEPLDRLSLRAEGRLEYQALLFIPSHAPFDLHYRDQQYGLQLYVRRVLIMDHCRSLLPPYLRFVKGVADSADLPLNVSRELIQQDRHIAQMQAWLSRKLLDHLLQLKQQDEPKYLLFWKAFGQVLKEGVTVDEETRGRILPLLVFESSQATEGLVGLDDYVSRMKPDQTEIYYLTGDSRAAVERSPHLEAFRARGYEVLYLVDPIDEIVTQAVTEYDGRRLRSVGLGTVEIGSEEERQRAQADLASKQAELGCLLDYLRTTLDEWVKEARLSTRLETSPVCLVGAEHDLSPHLERLLRQSHGDAAPPRQKRILELNPNHALTTKLQERFARDPKDPTLIEYAHLLLGYALLAEGSELPDPARFTRAMDQLLITAL